MSTPKIIQFAPNSLPLKNVPCQSNLMSYPEYLYSSITYSVKLTASKKELSNVGQPLIERFLFIS